MTSASALTVSAAGCDIVRDVDPQALGATYTFDARSTGEPYSVSVVFEGRREDVAGEPGERDRFSVVETVARVVPGSGRISLTARVENVNAGRWAVSAAPVAEADGAPVDSRPLPARALATGTTVFAPLARVRGPGVRIGAWPALVATGAGVALLVQGLLAARLSLPVASIFLLSVVACLVGLVGAKVYYLLEHPEHRGRGLLASSGGMCLQGFVLAAVAAVVVQALLEVIPVGELLDITVPGLLFGAAVGRIGCFLGGCCVGRPTASRWGLWSSDRRLGVRRIPTQLVESALALTLGLIALAVVLTVGRSGGGTVFVGAIAAYTTGRQLLLPLRNLPRNTTHGRTVILLACAVVLIGAVVVGLS
ncbi:MULTISPECIES: prolipoprotein diacylglyceryl transferase family protein [unclassified Pseudonocardia]|uniref:prolipoprotein diacylglyceryl transferase family protein n=1 Tax=unclassified Pseudonocardia TaxID=2619320 RepID=UPI000969ED4F|nr:MULTISPECIES: prolipoprotein diacylglyceryl transferase family protein [unclassified Pseudonocardia]MBN9098039.1 prolipoprotein diacylglyceryl transferase [Pseudonocardia sp.]OJY54435.1 MAG: hypothetical protein BGP03_23165 [Pseudonocardia sp. 73-21]